ncbi:MAG: 23S rRNA (adenine(2503)-C(2))-methyltransferase RlmN [Oscillospiraceae bacterium]|jgi:23S rRNA (adenine2503-C2)-methyltransferase|nr:23S rRNA (adenine(2503)-C(2))-methyltransferase RlmN [Oscillospiraceae bacterium]
MTNALDLTPAQWREALAEMNQPAFRAGQVFSWLHKGADFAEMGNLPASLRKALAAEYDARPVMIAEKFISQIDGTVKYLYRLRDDQLIEGVRMRYHHGDTLCLSTQVGCRMGCAFCASGLEGLARNLSAGEMIGQIIAANRDEPKIHNLVLMGSGEPLDNFDNTLDFLRLLREEGGLSISLRSVSLSTCGIAPRIRALADAGLPVTLSVSLHAPDDALRRSLMPIANAYPMDELLSACRYYIKQTGRRVIFEYALIAGVNAAPQQAQALAALLRGMQCHVNLIPLNPVPERGLPGASQAEVAAFENTLKALRISVTRRREMGRDISGACGQLRRRRLHTEGACP